MVDINYTFKIALVGNAGVGKSAMSMRFTRNVFPHLYDATIGVEFATKTLNVEYDGEIHTVKLQIWDTSGTEQFKSLTVSYYRNIAAVIIVYDLREPQLENIKGWIKEVENANPQNEDLPIMLAGNKHDLKNSFDSNFIDLCGLTSVKHPIKHMVVSAKTNYNVSILFTTVSKMILERIHTGANLRTEKGIIYHGSLPGGITSQNISLLDKQEKNPGCCNC